MRLVFYNLIFLNFFQISSESAMDSMISSAARAKSELVESKQQINVLEAHSRRFASERESLYSQIESLKVSFFNFCSLMDFLLKFSIIDETKRSIWKK